MTAVQELEQLVATVAERVGPAVVRIGRGPGRGSGVVVGDGLILTNAHNLRGPETTVTFADGRQVTAEIRGVDVDSDVAVLAAETGTTPAPEWAAEGPAQPGPVVVAVARAGEGLRVTWGTVSAVAAAFRGPRGRRITGSIEHTAPMARGSSGGPIVDSEGRLLGINTNRLADGFYLAVPADAALREKVDGLARGESPNRRRLGVGLAPGHVARRLRRSVGLPERDGLLVRAVVEESPAAHAGLRTGDLLAAAGGQALTNADELYDALDGAGETLLLTVVRGVEELSVTVSFAEAGATKEEGSA
jgi:S1-C subfamily serine protease